MKEYVKRMEDEFNELSIRRQKLENFIICQEANPTTVSKEKLVLLRLQENAMKQYEMILKERLLLEKKDEDR